MIEPLTTSSSLPSKLKFKLLFLNHTTNNESLVPAIEVLTPKYLLVNKQPCFLLCGSHSLLKEPPLRVNWKQSLSEAERVTRKKKEFSKYLLSKGGNISAKT